MRKIIATGEAILDIVFKNQNDIVAVPGGSAFNTLVSLARTGLPTTFVGEVGMDRVGEIIRAFMEDNCMNTDYLHREAGMQTPVSLAFLNQQQDATFSFYHGDMSQLINHIPPTLQHDDLLLISSFYALNPQNRSRIKQLLQLAKQHDAIVYYDVNFRQPHKNQADKLLPAATENYQYASIVRGSNEDFQYLYGMTDMEQVYQQVVQPHCKILIVTQGQNAIKLYTPNQQLQLEVNYVKPLSTIGAGDAFNAGVLYALVKYGVKQHDLQQLNQTTWEKILGYGATFAANVCRSYYNYVDEEFVKKLSLSSC